MTPLVLFFKAHVAGYTRRDGAFVKPHEDSRPSAQPKVAVFPVKQPAKPKVWYHGTTADFKPGQDFSLGHFGSGAFADSLSLGSKGFLPAIYFTDDKAHAEQYGENLVKVTIDHADAHTVDAGSILKDWAKELGYDDAQEMIDEHFDGNVYEALGADELFNGAAIAARDAGKKVAIVDFGDFKGSSAGQKFGGKVAIVVDPSSVKRVSEP